MKNHEFLYDDGDLQQIALFEKFSSAWFEADFLKPEVPPLPQRGQGQVGLAVQPEVAGIVFS